MCTDRIKNPSGIREYSVFSKPLSETIGRTTKETGRSPLSVVSPNAIALSDRPSPPGIYESRFTPRWSALLSELWLTNRRTEKRAIRRRSQAASRTDRNILDFLHRGIDFTQSTWYYHRDPANSNTHAAEYRQGAGKSLSLSLSKTNIVILDKYCD